MSYDFFLFLLTISQLDAIVGVLFNIKSKSFYYAPSILW